MRLLDDRRVGHQLTLQPIVATTRSAGAAIRIDVALQRLAKLQGVCASTDTGEDILRLRRRDLHQLLQFLVLVGQKVGCEFVCIVGLAEGAVEAKPAVGFRQPEPHLALLHIDVDRLEKRKPHRRLRPKWPERSSVGEHHGVVEVTCLRLDQRNADATTVVVVHRGGLHRLARDHRRPERGPVWELHLQQLLRLVVDAVFLGGSIHTAPIHRERGHGQPDPSPRRFDQASRPQADAKPRRHGVSRHQIGLRGGARQDTRELSPGCLLAAELPHPLALRDHDLVAALVFEHHETVLGGARLNLRHRRGVRLVNERPRVFDEHGKRADHVVLQLEMKPHQAWLLGDRLNGLLQEQRHMHQSVLQRFRQQERQLTNARLGDVKTQQHCLGQFAGRDLHVGQPHGLHHRLPPDRLKISLEARPSCKHRESGERSLLRCKPGEGLREGDGLSVLQPSNFHAHRWIRLHDQRCRLPTGVHHHKRRRGHTHPPVERSRDRRRPGPRCSGCQIDDKPRHAPRHHRPARQTAAADLLHGHPRGQLHLQPMRGPVIDHTGQPRLEGRLPLGNPQEGLHVDGQLRRTRTGSDLKLEAIVGEAVGLEGLHGQRALIRKAIDHGCESVCWRIVANEARGLRHPEIDQRPTTQHHKPLMQHRLGHDNSGQSQGRLLAKQHIHRPRKPHPQLLISRRRLKQRDIDLLGRCGIAFLAADDLPATHLRTLHRLHQPAIRHLKREHVSLPLPHIEIHLPGGVHPIFADVDHRQRASGQRLIDTSRRHL